MSRMIVVLGILGFIAMPATAHAAAPDAWSVGGPGSTFVAGCQGLGSLENDLVEQIPDFVAGLQLEDPDLKGLRADLLKTLGLKGKRSFAQAFALRPDGAVVLHVMHKPGAAQAPDWVVAFDVTNGQTFSGNMIKVFKAVTARAQKADLESRREELKASRETAERHRNQAIQHRPMRDGVAADAPFECPDDMHDDGLLNCAPRGICDSLFHDGGAGTCVPRGSCSRGYRLWERDGTCNKKKEPKPGPAVKVGRQQKLPGGGREVEICPTEIEGCFRIRVVGNLAFLAESAAVLDALQPEATELQPTAGLFHAGGGTGMGCLLRLRRREPNEPPVPWTPFVESVELISRVAEDGSHTALDLHLGPAADGQLTFLRPSETGADVRLRMKTLVHGDLSGWWRVGLDLQAAWTQMQSMIPPEGLTNIKKEWTDRTGLDLEKDVIGVLTGDLLGTCEGGALGCVLSVGIRGKKGALAAMKRLQNTLEKTLPKGEV
ncbi:MAG: hypothetical protein VX938_08965, partial [Myxococcota bacterium]|nr:hypothetical protein [Myxococcota bacterium]